MAKPPKPEARKVFISFARDSREEREPVQRLADRLRKAGVDTWLESGETRPSKATLETAWRRLEEADYVVLVWTDLAHRSFRSWLWADGVSAEQLPDELTSDVLRSILRDSAQHSSAEPVR